MKKVSIGTKLTEEDFVKISALAERENLSTGALIRILVDGILNGDMMLDKGELKTSPDESSISGIFEEEHEELSRLRDLYFDRLLRAFERKDYTDNAIRQAIDQIVGQINDSPKINTRRSKEDWGA